MIHSSAWLIEDGDLERFLESVQAPSHARQKLELAWRAGIRRTVHVRLERKWVIGFTRARYRGDLPPQAYCKPLGGTPAPESRRLETLLESMRQVRLVHGWARFGSRSTRLDSHLKVVLRDAGMGLNSRLIADLALFERFGIEMRIDPNNGELWLRPRQSL